MSGIINVVSHTRVDRDYADLWRDKSSSWATIVRNNSVETAQSLPVPAIVGGYLSEYSGSYDNGRAYPADDKDYYSAALQPGDSIFLQVFPATGESPEDVNLSVMVGDQELCGDGACIEGEVVRMSLPQTMAEEDSDKRTIRLAISGGGPVRYVLTLAPLGGVLSADASWPEPEMAVNEAIITTDVGSVQALSAAGLSQNPDIEILRSLGPRTLHVRRPVSVTAQSLSASAKDDPRQATVEWIRKLRAETGATVEPNYVATLLATDPADDLPGFPDSDNSWNLKMIKVNEAWLLTTTSGAGTGVGVAVMDTGLFSPTPDSYGSWHDDLEANVVVKSAVEQGELKLLDFVSGDYDVDSNSGPDINPATPPTPGSSMTSFHGTHVAGIVGARDNTFGTVGIADEATLFPYRVLGVNRDTGEDGSGKVSDLIDAINAAAARNDVDVINLSLGGLPVLDSLQLAIDNALDKGKLVVAAGGNSGNALPVYPAANRGVVGVGAVNRSGARASYSSFGQSVDLVAPGGDLGTGADGIYNAWCDVANSDELCNASNVDGWTSGYAYLAGTSMSAPHVSGVYALMHRLGEQNGVPVTQDRFRALMIDGQLTTIGEPLQNYDLVVHGAGLLNANAAVMAALDGGFPTVVSAHPRVLFLDENASDVSVELEVLSEMPSPSLDITGVVEVPDWLNLTDAGGDGLTANQALPSELRLSVNSKALPDDRLANGLITIPYGNEGRALDIPVIVLVPDDPVDRDAGRHMVFLIDADDSGDGSSQRVDASFQSGRYTFSFKNVEPGEYFLVSGTDLDNNGKLAESGEAYAEYPITGSPRLITVEDRSLSGLEMTTSFRRPTLSEMGLPRYGFEGYPVPERSNVDQSVNKQLK
ncbi:hypothetical protein GCM10007071_23420 [Marinobacter zhanjiangensis]|uniref:Peptidase S8/S53 domain-containing protein n=1 Tax=Marinobacter zhanjiangensis TaxID=578215 RepID=A0ABQ3B5E9_9GAMM|nr:hypothetical protein GCM10007071_23420 [Marinobacter zhanjiangensis]